MRIELNDGTNRIDLAGLGPAMIRLRAAGGRLSVDARPVPGDRPFFRSNCPDGAESSFELQGGRSWSVQVRGYGSAWAEVSS
jgi:hypothetical protein